MDAGTEASAWAAETTGTPEKPTIRVAIVSKVRLHAEALAGMLSGYARVQVVGGVTNHQAAHDAGALEPDVVLVDMAGETSWGAIRAIRSEGGAAIVALAIAETEEDIVECAKAGVSGYVTRSASVADLVTTVESVSRGELVCSPRVAAALFRRAGALTSQPAAPLQRLTRREAEILRLVEMGLSNKQIAQHLFVELATVKNHLHNIFEKLQVHTRGQAAMIARTAVQQWSN
jgi:two-component system nitrate/nitrite response regulator NarL